MQALSLPREVPVLFEEAPGRAMICRGSNEHHERESSSAPAGASTATSQEKVHSTGRPSPAAYTFSDFLCPVSAVCSPFVLALRARPSQAWFGGFIAGVLRYLFVLATGARELPPSPIGPAGRWFAKVAALASVAALAVSVGNGTAAVVVDTAAGGREVGPWVRDGGGAEGSSPFLCAAGVAVLCASFSVDFFQVWVLLPREAAAAKAAAAAVAAPGVAAKGNFPTTAPLRG